MATAYKDMAKRIASLADEVSTGFTDAYDALTKRVVRVGIVPSSTAGTATNHYLMTAEADLELISAEYIPNADLSESDTDYATLDLNKADGAGGAFTSIDAITTQTAGSGGTGDWSDGDPVAWSVSVADTLTAGQSLLVEITKTGCTGVAVPAGTVEITYRLL